MTAVRAAISPMATEDPVTLRRTEIIRPCSGLYPGALPSSKPVLDLESDIQQSSGHADSHLFDADPHASTPCSRTPPSHSHPWLIFSPLSASSAFAVAMLGLIWALDRV